MPVGQGFSFGGSEHHTLDFEAKYICPIQWHFG